MITVMVMDVAMASFVAFWFVPVALFLILPHFDKPYGLVTGAIVMAVATPITLMRIRRFDDHNPIIVGIRICDSDMTMYPW